MQGSSKLSEATQVKRQLALEDACLAWPSAKRARWPAVWQGIWPPSPKLCVPDMPCDSQVSLGFR